MKVFIRLLVFLGIIGLFYIILIPTIGGTGGHRATLTWYSSNMKQIATAYMVYSNSGSRAKNIKMESPYDMAVFLARNVGLNDIRLYVSIEFAETLDDTRIIVDEQYVIDREIVEHEILYEFASPLSLSSPASTTPLLWTRGLRRDGTWGEDSILGGVGHIAFLDTHVEYFSEDQPVELKKFKTDELTSDVQEAIGLNVNILRPGVP